MSNNPSSTKGKLSMGNVPESWLEAEKDSPTGGDISPLTERTRTMVMPLGARASTLSVVLGAVLSGFIAGLCWFLLHVSSVYTGPWIAIPAGIAIAVGVRITAGPADAPVRALVSLFSFVATVALVLLTTTWNDMAAIYGEVDWGTLETFLTETRLSKPDHLISYALGAAASLQVSHLLRIR